jgi:acetolactate synthase regulatory subunit
LKDASAGKPDLDKIRKKRGSNTSWCDGMQCTQHQVRLVSRRTYDSLGRILDLLRKMEFELTELRMVKTSGMAEITISFVPLGHHSASALLRCIGQVVGVTQVHTDDVWPLDISKER